MAPPPPRRILLLAMTALIGVGISVALTQHFYGIHSGTAGFKSFCNLGERVNCDLVAASPYAELFGGLPVSSFAAGLFLSIFGISLFGTNAFWRREALRAAFVLAISGSVLSLLYLAIMITVLKTYCLLCLATDAAVFICLGILISLKPENFAVHKADRQKWKTFAAISIFSVVISVAGLKILSGTSEGGDFNPNSVANQILGSSPVSVGSGPEFSHIGPESAPVTIVEFSDFQCPFCRMGAFMLNSVVNHYESQPAFKGKVRVVFRNYPLDPSCNRYVPNAMHQFACTAAKVAVCANRAGKFEAVYQTLFENQASFAAGKPEELGVAAGLDSAALQACIHAPETESAISRDIEEAKVLGVESTPTFYINGHKIEGVTAPSVWYLVIDKLLK